MVGELEYGRLKLPPPQHQILLSVPVELAAARARHRARPSPIEGAMPTSGTTPSNAGPAPCTPNWPRLIGADRGLWCRRVPIRNSYRLAAAVVRNSPV